MAEKDLEERKPVETKEKQDETKKESRIKWWMWFSLASVIVFVALAIAVSINLLSLGTLLLVFLVTGLFIGTLLFIIWVLFFRKPKMKTAKILTKIEALNIIKSYAEMPAELGGCMEKIDMLHPLISVAKRIGVEGKPKTLVMHLRTKAKNNTTIYDFFLPMVEGQECSHCRLLPHESWSDYEKKVELLLKTVVEETGLEETQTFYDSMGVPIREIKRPASQIISKEEEAELG